MRRSSTGDSMNYRTTAIFFIALFAASCRETVTSPASGVNLIASSSFEVDGTPTLQGWTVSDTSAVHFSTDIPHDGSGYSIILHAEWFGPSPTNFISRKLAAQSGTHLYWLSYWGKRIGISGGISVLLSQHASQNSILCMSLPVADTSWTFYSQTDTSTANTDDSLTIKIGGGASEIAAGTTYFNTCELERLE